MTTETVDFKNPNELTKLLGEVEAQVTRLVIRHDYDQEETPERTDANSIELGGLFDKFVNLDSLHINAHIFAPCIRHDSLRKLSLEGAIALTELNLQSCELLSLSIMGDMHGVACDIDAFDSLFRNTKLPKLSSLDLRHLNVEVFNKKSPKVIDRIQDAPWFNNLRALGLFSNCISLSQIKKLNIDTFDFLVVSGLLSSFDKNPTKSGKVWFENSPSSVTLSQALEAITMLPSLASVTPKLGAQEFDAVVAQLSETDFKIEQASVLAALVSPFCKKRQWERMDSLLKLVRKKSRTMRVFLDTLEKLEAVVAMVVEKKPDAEGQVFLAFLREKVAL